MLHIICINGYSDNNVFVAVECVPHQFNCGLHLQGPHPHSCLRDRSSAESQVRGTAYEDTSP